LPAPSKETADSVPGRRAARFSPTSIHVRAHTFTESVQGPKTSPSFIGILLLADAHSGTSVRSCVKEVPCVSSLLTVIRMLAATAMPSRAHTSRAANQGARRAHDPILPGGFKKPQLWSLISSIARVTNRVDERTLRTNTDEYGERRS
jgi:hypothetical protein